MGPGFEALKWFSGLVQEVIGFTNQGTSLVFGGLLGENNGFVFALNGLFALLGGFLTNMLNAALVGVILGL